MLIIRVIHTNLAFDVLIIKSIANLFIVFLYIQVLDDEFRSRNQRLSVCHLKNKGSIEVSGKALPDILRNV